MRRDSPDQVGRPKVLQRPFAVNLVQSQTVDGKDNIAIISLRLSILLHN